MSLTKNELLNLAERGYDGFVRYQNGPRSYVGKIKTFTDFDFSMATVITTLASGENMEFRVRKLALYAATRAEVRNYYDGIRIDYEAWRVTEAAKRNANSANRRAV
jgi:hypothetical protein